MSHSWWPEKPGGILVRKDIGYETNSNSAEFSQTTSMPVTLLLVLKIEMVSSWKHKIFLYRDCPLAEFVKHEIACTCISLASFSKLYSFEQLKRET